MDAGVFKVLFQANRGLTYYGDISIDDISFACEVDALCGEDTFSCYVPQCIPKYRLIQERLYLLHERIRDGSFYFMHLLLH